MTHSRYPHVHCVLLCSLALVADAASGTAPPTRPTYTALADGVPVSGSVPYAATAFYRLVVPLPLPRIEVIALGLVGNPDLMVTTGPYWDPEPSNSEWYSSGSFGSDVIVIPANATVTAPGGFCKSPTYSNCTINIGVYGARASNYSLVATTSAANQVLGPGRPTLGELPPGGLDFFNVSAGATHPALVTFTVSPLEGAAAGSGLALFVAKAGAPRPVPSDPATYCARAPAPPARTSGSGVLTLTLSNTSAVCGTTTGYVVAVWNNASVVGAGGGGLVGYTLLATTSEGGETTLIDGVPFEGGSSVEGGHPALFAFSGTLGPRGCGTDTLELVLSPSRGQAIMYVNLGTTTGGGPPSPGSASFTSAGGAGTQVLTISRDDARFIAACGSDATVCVAHVAVAATTSSSDWGIVARASAYVALPNGVPLEGSAPSGGVSYYRFTSSATAGQGLVVSVAPLSGDPAVFVGCDSNNRTVRPDPRVPSSFLWASVVTGDGMVVIDGSDPFACTPPCNYYIGVAEQNASAAVGFVVLAHGNSGNAGVPTALVLGDLLRDVVPHNAYNAYVLPFEPSAPSITLSLYTASGNAALFASVTNGSGVSGAPPTAAGAQYAADASGGATAWAAVTLAQTDSAFTSAGCGSAPCTVLVWVYGNTTAAGASSQFLLEASADVREVADGVPVQGVVQVSGSEGGGTEVYDVDESPF